MVICRGYKMRFLWLIRGYSFCSLKEEEEKVT